MEKFNSYLTNIDAGLIKEICTSRGKAVHFKKNEYFVRADEASLYVGFVVKGVFRYRCVNSAEGKTYNVGFAFSDEFIADYPACLYGLPSEMDIQALTACDVYVCEARHLEQLYGQSMEMQRYARITAEQLFLQTFSRYLDIYRKTPEERYRELLQRCPEMLQVLPLKEVASYLRITPTTMSNIRRRITFED